MSESDKDIFAELDKSLQGSGETAKRAIDDEKAYFAEHMPELEQLVRWWNIKMDEFNYGKQKLRIKEDYNTKKNGWVVYLFEPPTFGKGLMFKISLQDKVRFGGRINSIFDDALIVQVGENNKAKVQKKFLKKKGLKGLQALMVKMISKSSNYQDAIPDK